MKILIISEDVRCNDENFILTPYLIPLYVNNKHKIKLFGLGIGWGYWNISFGLGFNIPKKIKLYRHYGR